jgi:hypothetical protein
LYPRGSFLVLATILALIQSNKEVRSSFEII